MKEARPIVTWEDRWVFKIGKRKKIGDERKDNLIWWATMRARGERHREADRVCNGGVVSIENE